MKYTYYIDDIDITSDVLENYTIQESRNIIGDDKLLVNAFSVRVGDSDGLYTISNPVSIFFGRSASELSFKVLDEFGMEIYMGFITNCESDIAGGITTITVGSAFDTSLEKTLIYLADDINPITAVKQVLIINGLTDYIDNQSFTFAEQYFTDLGFDVNISYSIDSTTTIHTFLQLIANITGADIYFTQGKIKVLIHEVYTGVVGNELIIPNYSLLTPVSLKNDTDNIRNQYSYTLTIATIETSLYDVFVGRSSRNKYGERSYNAINMNANSPVNTENIIAINDIGTRKIQVAQDEKFYITFSVDNDLFPYPFELSTVFKFDKLIRSVDLTNYIWQIMSISKTKATTEITAMRLN